MKMNLPLLKLLDDLAVSAVYCEGNNLAPANYNIKIWSEHSAVYTGAADVFLSMKA